MKKFTPTFYNVSFAGQYILSNNLAKQNWFEYLMVLMFYVQGEEKREDAPSIEELVEKESVDRLEYMGWKEDKP